MCEYSKVQVTQIHNLWCKRMAAQSKSQKKKVTYNSLLSSPYKDNHTTTNSYIFLKRKNNNHNHNYNHNYQNTRFEILALSGDRLRHLTVAE